MNYKLVLEIANKPQENDILVFKRKKILSKNFIFDSMASEKIYYYIKENLDC